MKFTANEADHYGGQGGGGFFSLKNDKDTAKVRFMYNDEEDVVGYAVHQVEVDGKKRYVNCLREYDDPVDKCPFCKAKMFTTAKLFVPLYNVDEDKAQVWERGKKFFAKMSSLCGRYATKHHLVNQEFEIERNGKPHDTSTTYEIYPVDSPDDTELEDLPESPKILGGVVLDKTAEEMEEYLETGSFPSDGNNGNGREYRRRETRRTPSRRNNEDEF